MSVCRLGDLPIGIIANPVLGLGPGVIGVACDGSLAYRHRTLRFMHREQRGVRRSQLCFDFAQAAHERRRDWRMMKE